jgi:thioesterase domain-containing protein
VYEIAQQLVDQGDTVKLLGLLDSYCPVEYHSYLAHRMWRHYRNLSRQGLGYMWQMLPKMRKKLSSLQSGMSSSTQQNFRDLELDAVNLQAHALLKPDEQHTVNQDYQFVPYPGEITLFRAQDDPDAKLNWRELAIDGLVIHDIPGTHLGMLTEPNVQNLAQKLEQILQGESNRA